MGSRSCRPTLLRDLHRAPAGWPSRAASSNGGDVTLPQLFDYFQQRVVPPSSTAQRPSFIANTETFYPLTRYPRAIAPSVVFEKDAYISYDRGDPAMRDWVTKIFQPEFASHGCS